MQKLTVDVVKAILTRKTELIKKMNPYVQLKIKENNNRTKILKGKGDMPEWNQTFEYILSTDNWAHVLQLQVKDEDGLGDYIVGEATIEINPSNLEVTNGQKWYSLKYEKKPAGKILINIICAPYHLGYGNIPSSSTVNNSIRMFQSDTKPVYEYDSKVIKMNQRSGLQLLGRQHSQMKMEKTGSNFENTNQTFFTGRKGIRPVGYSVDKMRLNTYNQSSGIKLSQIPSYLKMNQTSNIRI